MDDRIIVGWTAGTAAGLADATRQLADRALGMAEGLDDCGDIDTVAWDATVHLLAGLPGAIRELRQARTAGWREECTGLNGDAADALGWLVTSAGAPAMTEDVRLAHMRLLDVAERLAAMAKDDRADAGTAVTA